MAATVIQTRAYLRKSGHRLLDARLRAHCELYNAALEERRTAWRQSQDSISFAHQSRQLTQIRRDMPDTWATEDRRIAVATLGRLRKAFDAFFRRLKAGEKPGYPRFKPSHRFRTLAIYSGACNYLHHDPERNAGVVRIKGLPALRYKSARVPADSQPKEIKVTRKPNGVYLSMTFETDDPPPASERKPASPVGLDVGVAKRLTLHTGEKVTARERDDRRKRRLQRKLDRQRTAAIKDGRAEYVFAGVSRRTNRPRFRLRWIGGPSSCYIKTREQAAKLDHAAYVSNRNELHLVSSDIVSRHDAIFVEDLRIANMTRSAAGTEEDPGSNVAQKRGLNRSILNQGWGQIFDMLEYKAERAGIRFGRVDPKYTSQTCPVCGVVDAGSRKGESFDCLHCGFRLDADQNGALNVLLRGLSDIGYPVAGESVIAGVNSTSLNHRGLPRGGSGKPRARAAQFNYGRMLGIPDSVDPPRGRFRRSML